MYRRSPRCGLRQGVASAHRQGKLQGGTGIDETLLGTTKRTDGQTQVTYNRHPLYYFRGYRGTPADKKSGDVNGQGFYGLCNVRSPRGTPIR